MPRNVEHIVAVLEGQADAEAVDDALRNAAFLFEKARGLPPCAWPDEVVKFDPSPQDVRRLRDAVTAYVQRNGVGSWTLGKCVDASLKPVLRAVLRRQLHGNAGQLFQAMIALQNLGEPVFGESQSHSILEEERNRQLASQYLSRQ